MSGLALGSLFAGIGGFDLAAERAGIRVAWQSEIERSACAVLAHHWPDVPNHGDITRISGAEIEPVDIITGGFPCQDLSVAGRRAGLAGERSGLYFEIVRLVREMRGATGGRFPAFVVLENVLGLLSSRRGRDFAVVLRELRQLGALDIGWRVLDAQHFGVPQRRRRVFVVADFGGQRAAEILFEPESGGGDSQARREARQDVAGTLESRTTAGGFPGTDGAVAGHVVARPAWDEPPTLAAGSNPHSNAAGRRREDDESLMAFEWQASASQSMNPGKVAASLKVQQIPAIAHAITTHMAKGGDPATDNYVTHGLTAEGHDASEDGTGRGTPLAVSIRGRDGGATAEVSDIPSALRASQGGGDKAHVLTGAVSAKWAKGTGGQMVVRRLMPVECLRLQGFPDDWLDLNPELSDSAKYRCIGNAVAVPVVEWILRRLVSCAR